MKSRKYLSLILVVLLAACNTVYQPAQLVYDDYRITAQGPKDSGMLQMLAPYADSLNKSMNEVVGFAEESLDKKQPSGTLGHFVADAMLYEARKRFEEPLDAAFVNYGGQRITQLPKGAITRSTVFELMPFENLVIVQKIRGNVLQQFLDHIAMAGGWPVSGITFQIKDKKAVNVLVNGVLLDFNKTYHIVNSDYVANGGDNAAMLKDIPQINKGYLMRDAIFDYIRSLKAEGKNIRAQTENRITYAQ
ncbi:MAG: 5'-nucleotidase C-terminal domain-containing protein [Chitinophagaceae bacterium]